MLQNMLSMWQAYQVGIDFEKVKYLCELYMNDKTVGEGDSDCVPQENLAHFLIVSSYKGLAFIMRVMSLIASARCGSTREYLAIASAVQVLLLVVMFINMALLMMMMASGVHCNQQELISTFNNSYMVLKCKQRYVPARLSMSPPLDASICSMASPLMWNTHDMQFFM